MDWARKTKITNVPCAQGKFISDYLIAIPNGGRRRLLEARRLKLEGVKAGVSDLFFALPVGKMSGLWIEMKAPGKKPTPKQKQWLLLMSEAGYFAGWCDGWKPAQKLICDYLEQ